ncbi:PHB depolymerase family esterase [Bdellovibrio bacteriovorus]|uniref:alpha/beta hydrolase family esterase n=1 Tax=Bdellovibrio bacteriovorus TaxID=959 RepID=UPI0035A983FF
MFLRQRQILTLLLACSIFFVVPQVGAIEIAYSYYNESSHASNTESKRPLILWIHGCRQSDEKFVDVTDIVEKTKHLNPLIIAPFQESKVNLLRCWNFTSSEMQKRDGEFMQVIDEVKRHIDSGEADPNRIFVGGFSSGAMFANHLALCFPDIFKGALIHSGAPFDVTGSMSTSSAQEHVKDALACAGSASQNGEPVVHRLKTLFYIHGKKDKVVPKFLGRRAFEQSVLYMDALDDEKFNSSYRVTPLVSRAGLSIHFGDGSSTNYIEIENMSHRWSGSKPGSDFSSPETLSSIDVFLKLTDQLH